MLAGGVGAARFLRGLISADRPATSDAPSSTPATTPSCTAWSISPDLDTIIYTLAGAIDPERGWGLAGETWQAMAALERYAAVRPPTRAAGGTGSGSATAIWRPTCTARLGWPKGATLTEVTGEIARAWGLDVDTAADDR